MRKTGIKFNLEDIGKLLTNLTNNSKSVYWLSSADFKKIVYISPAYEKIWGRSREILYECPHLWLTHMHPEDAETYKQYYDPNCLINEPYEDIYRIVRPNGEFRWIIDRGFPLFDDEGNSYALTGVALDVTKEIENKLAFHKSKEEGAAAYNIKTQFLENFRPEAHTTLLDELAIANVGATFTHFPLQKNSNVTNSIKKNQFNKKKNILLIEEELLISEVTKSILSSLDCNVDIAKSGEMAISQAKNNEYDLIFLEVQLPDIPGYEVAKNIRLNELGKIKRVPIIALVTCINMHKKKNCMDAGINAIILKPLFKEKALEILNAFIPEKSLETDSSGISWLTMTGKVIDSELGTKLANNNLGLTRKIFNLIIEAIPLELEQLEQTYSVQDWNEIEKIVHRIRGKVCYGGLPRLHRACMLLENYLVAGGGELVNALYNQFIYELETVRTVYLQKKEESLVF